MCRALENDCKIAEEDYDLDMLDSPRPDRLRLHKHMDSRIVKCIKNRRRGNKNATKKSFRLQLFAFIHHFSFQLRETHLNTKHSMKTRDNKLQK